MINGNHREKLPETTEFRLPFWKRSVSMTRYLLSIAICLVVTALLCAIIFWLGFWQFNGKSEARIRKVETVATEALKKEKREFLQKEEKYKEKMEGEMKTRTREMAEGMFLARIQKAAPEITTDYLKEKWLGSFDVKDFQATKVSHRQAGVKGKEGIIGLPKDTLCRVHCYVINEKKVGVGVASIVIEGNTYFLSLNWHPGAVSAPNELKEFRIVQGKKIEIVNSK